MSTSQPLRQLDLFEQGVANLIEDLLDNPQQPSASELLKLCEDRLGVEARENLKEAVLNLINSKDLPTYKKKYLTHIVEDRSLDRAIAGSDDCQEKER